MATVAPLDTFQEVSLPQGTVRYCDQGVGPALVFIHGLFANGVLWSRVIPQLVSRFRCVAPELPLGAHSSPLLPDADLCFCQAKCGPLFNRKSNQVSH